MNRKLCVEVFFSKSELTILERAHGIKAPRKEASPHWEEYWDALEAAIRTTVVEQAAKKLAKKAKKGKS